MKEKFKGTIVKKKKNFLQKKETELLMKQKSRNKVLTRQVQ